MSYSTLFNILVASSLVIGAIVMFVVDLTIGALVVAVDLASLWIVYVLLFRDLIRKEREGD